MSHERLDALIAAHQEALAADEQHVLTYDTILGILSALNKGQVTEGQALRLLGYQAIRLNDDPTNAALYRQAAAAIRQMQREEH